MMLCRGMRRAVAAVVLVLAATAPAWAGGQGFSASVGLEITYAPAPPPAYDVGSSLCLGFEIPGFALESETRFELTDFAYQGVFLGVDLGVAQISEEVRFEPTFSWNELSIDLSLVGVALGADWIFANIGSVQTPSYEMGIVVVVATEIPCGFGFSSVTGFGAVDLVNVIGGEATPFAAELCSLFAHLDALCAPELGLDVTIVGGLYFEEELLRFTCAFEGLLASQTTWFDAGGLSRMTFELGYRLDDPLLAFLVAIGLDGGFSVEAIDVVFDVALGGVHFTSWTGFVEPPFPAPVPVFFAGQDFAIAVEWCGVTVTSETDFDDLFLFEAEIVAIEATIDPFTFVSLTTFDAGGFASECVEGEVAFGGVRLFTSARFTWAGVEFVSFGFEFSF